MLQDIQIPTSEEASLQDTKPDVATLDLLHDAERDEEFNFPDGNIYLRVENTVFFIHKFKLLDFRKIEKMVRSHDEILLKGSVLDFRNVLRVLYLSFKALAHFNLDTPTLISALRLATTYEYQDLRVFAIQQLELKALPSLDYLPLALKFGIEDWTCRAMDYLVSRDEPITETEAELLGTKLFVTTVARREKRLVQKPEPLEHQNIATSCLPSGPHVCTTSTCRSSGCRDAHDEAAKTLPVPSTAEQANLGPVGASNGGNSAGTSGSTRASSDLEQSVLRTSGISSGTVLGRETESCNRAKAAQQTQEYTNETSIGATTMTNFVHGKLTSASELTIAFQPTETRCKPDPRAIGSWTYPLNEDKQDYQLNIIERFFISGCVMLNFYNWFPTGKIVFIAPTGPLITGQIEACHSTCGIPGRDGIDLTSTASKIQRQRASQWKARRVFYVDPQTFLDDLKDGTCDVQDIVLVAIGEADHAIEVHAYVLIVQFLMANNPRHRLLALGTAIDKTFELAHDIADGLGISRTKIQKEDGANLRPAWHKLLVPGVEAVEMSDAVNAIKNSLVAVMWLLLENVQELGGFMRAEPENLKRLYASSRKHKFVIRTNEVEQVTVSQRHLAIFSLILEGSVTTCERLLAEFYAGGDHRFESDWNAHGDWSTTSNHIKNHHLEAVSSGLKTRFPPHPKMQRLNELVRDHFDNKAPSPRAGVLVLTSFRNDVDEMVAHLNASWSGIRASGYIGRAERDEGGKDINQGDQATIISRFKDRKINVLVAAMIGQAGLDIGEIDLVLCYDGYGDTIRMLRGIKAVCDLKVAILHAEGRKAFRDDAIASANQDLKVSIIRIFDDATKMIPEEARSNCVEKAMENEPYDHEVHGRVSGKRAQTESKNSHAEVRKEEAGEEAEYFT
ncbi:3'-5' DNA helicase [Ceratobasidium sp. 395]|nr:3'-5' DNA helicase [Ceratobasidium sp. 395]